MAEKQDDVYFPLRFMGSHPVRMALLHGSVSSAALPIPRVMPSFARGRNCLSNTPSAAQTKGRTQRKKELEATSFLKHVTRKLHQALPPEHDLQT